MIKTLTPYYIYVNKTNEATNTLCDSYTLNVYIWAGLKTAAPTLPTYSRTRVNATFSIGTDKVNIGNLINDFIDFKLDTQQTTTVVNGNNQVWVKTEVLYSDQPETPQNIEINLALKGYGYFMEGENPQPSAPILLQGDEHKVNRSGYFVVPFLVDESTPSEAPEINLISVIGDQTTFNLNFTPEFIYLHHRLKGSTLWLHRIGYEPISPITYLIPNDGETEVQMVAFDPVTNQFVTSNTLTIYAP